VGVEASPSRGSQAFVEAVRNQIDRPWFLTILAATGLCAAYLLGALFNWGDVAERSLYSNLGLLPVGLTATLLAWCAAQSQPDRRSRTAWRLVSASFGCFFAGDLLFFIYQNVLGESPFPSLADVGYLAYYPLMFAGLVCLPGHGRNRVRRGLLSVDLAVLLLAGGALVVYVYLIPTLGSPRDDLLAYSLSAGYPIGDLLLLAGLATLLVRRGARHNQVLLVLLGSGLLVGLGADVVYGYQTIHGALQAGGLSDAGYMVSWILFAWASYTQFAQANRERPQDDVSN
jgi:diguanylate cyclase